MVCDHSMCKGPGAREMGADTWDGAGRSASSEAVVVTASLVLLKNRGGPFHARLNSNGFVGPTLSLLHIFLFFFCFDL